VEILETIIRVTRKIAPGRFPSFTEAHVMKALEEINLQKSVGRLKLSKSLHLGGGEIRTLVRHLKNEKLVEISKSGISLSEHGKRVLSDLRTCVSEQLEIPPTPLTVGSFNVAVRVIGMKDAVKYGLEQRDAAIMAGAKGATTLVFSKNKLTMPSVAGAAPRNDPAVRALLSKLNLNEGDVIIIGSADEKIRAELGARMAAIRLIECKSKNDRRQGTFSEDHDC
jgi:predicted transcriptional regulator